MAENGNTPRNSAASNLHNTQTGNESGQEFFEHQQMEYARLKRIFNFFRKKDDLDANIHQVVEYILSIQPSPTANALALDDVTDMIHSICQLDEILDPNFFRRTLFPFRMLRLCLDLHLADPVEESNVSSVRMLAEENHNQCLKGPD